ncbi:MAG: threonine synthase [Asticcacaulis sp.]
MTQTVPYIGTRGFAGERDFAGAILDGLAPDGGLYVPAQWPEAGAATAALSPGSYKDQVLALLRLFGAGRLGDAALETAAERTSQAFLKDGRTPLVQLEDDLWLLELFHGPTHAFKDMAMQMMAPLTAAALAQRDEDLLLITATSGDTGAAAVRAFGGTERIKLVVLHPHNRVSPVQRRQMTVDAPANVLNLAIEGDFDDCQRLVKTLLADDHVRAAGAVSSVNSINWGRLLGQVPYYLAAARASGVANPDFVVPTGNFGDAFAGWIARKIGGSVGHLHAAVNQNDALARALNDGVYQRTTARPSASISMDVQAPSNFERLVFEALGRDAARTEALFSTFVREGEVTLPADALKALRAEVSASSVSEAQTAAMIQTAHRRWGQVVCPHTAVGLVAALARRDAGAGPQIVLATAHAAKFPDAVEAALGTPPQAPAALAALENRPEAFAICGPQTDGVRDRVLAHRRA